jgi:hypothetical protein
MLESYGAKLELYEQEDGSDMETVSETNEDVGNARSERKFETEATSFGHVKPKLLTNNESSRYFDGYDTLLGDESLLITCSGLWSDLANEVSHDDPWAQIWFAKIHTEEHKIVESMDESSDTQRGYQPSDENGFLLGTQSQRLDLASFHPPLPALQQMWSAFVDKVDPMTKILHLPTFWTTLKQVVENPRHTSKTLDALIFGFYFATVTAMTANECQRILSQPKPTALARYRLAAQQALGNACFLKTTSLVTLQGYTFYLVRPAS